MTRIAISLLFTTLITGCGMSSDENARSGEKNDELARCAVDEAILVCINENCPDLTGDEFDSCFTDSCEEQHPDAPLDCALCVVENFEAGADAAGISEACTPTEATPQTFPCVADEGILVCINENCPDLTGDEFDSCFTDNCEEQHPNAAIECALCLVENFEAGADAAGISANCAPDQEPSQGACTTDEPVLVCINENCPDLTGDEFDSCFTDNCEEQHPDTPLDCALCLAENFEAGADAAGISEACQ